MKKWLFGAMLASAGAAQAHTTLVEGMCETRALDSQLTVKAATPVVVVHHRDGQMLSQTRDQVVFSSLVGLLSAASQINADCLAYLQHSNGLQVQPGDGNTLAQVYFHFDHSSLSDTSRRILDSVAKTMQQNPNFLTLEGHTDSQGSPAYNMALGLRRSQAVEQYLRAQGVPPQSMQATSQGESQPQADNASDAGRQQNRRVEIRL